jgi:hypothetical protein
MRTSDSLKALKGVQLRMRSVAPTLNGDRRRPSLQAEHPSRSTAARDQLDKLFGQSGRTSVSTPLEH